MVLRQLFLTAGLILKKKKKNLEVRHTEWRTALLWCQSPPYKIPPSDRPAKMVQAPSEIRSFGKIKKRTEVQLCPHPYLLCCAFRKTLNILVKNWLGWRQGYPIHLSNLRYSSSNGGRSKILVVRKVLKYRMKRSLLFCCEDLTQTRYPSANTTSPENVPHPHSKQCLNIAVLSHLVLLEMLERHHKHPSNCLIQ